jgi:sterol desaturase/sphingolipid hydroxylase (fatty acid hydroxylase superfamily)
MPLAGFPVWMVLLAQSWSLIYQFWIHTERVRRLPRPLEAVLNTPSHHRVHHGSNAVYLDKNYGGILIVWDRLFGSFVEEDDAEPCVYGTIKPLRSWNPLWANLSFYAELARDSWHTRSWADKVRRWFASPGWRPADVAAMFPGEPFDLQRRPYELPLTAARQAAALALFLAAMVGTLVLLWFAHTLGFWQLLAGASAVVTVLWAAGQVCTPTQPAAGGAPAGWAGPETQA